MNGLSIKALLIISLAMLATGCKLALTVTSGGDVTSLTGNRDCSGGSLCEYEVTDTSFVESFTAVPRAGYVFEKWQGGANYQCAESTNPTCTISTNLIDGLDEPARGIADIIIASGTIFYAQPLFTFVGIDTDEDGTADYLDPDDDNDGVLDADDNCPLEGPNLDGFGCPILSKTVFVTSESYTGNLGGLAGADQKCNDLAAAASLSGDYKAWLSDGIEAPSTRFTQSPDVSYQLVDGTVIAVGYDNVLAPALLAPINLTELGVAKPTNVWTNTSGGQPAASLGDPCPQPGFICGGSCNAWTAAVEPDPEGEQGVPYGESTAVSGAIGGGQFEGGWEFTSVYPLLSCASTAALYCFEQ